METNMRVLMSIVMALTLCCVASGQTTGEIQAHVEYLASDDLGGRKPGSTGMDKAIEYVQGEFKAMDLDAYRQVIRVRGVTCQNTMFVLPGRTDDRIVIGAHLDHIGTARKRGDGIYNGADDNASGCALVIAMAKELVKTEPECTIEFHFYTGEESGLIGSKAYVNNPLVDIEHYRFMLCLDMVGRLRTTGLIGGEDEFPFDDAVVALFDKYPFASGITWTEDTDDSDHSPWFKVGVPALLLHTGLHDEYHQPDDEADKINYEGMLRVCEYALDIVRSIDRDIHPAPVVVSPYILH
jgi:Zn-dependent M28 family amino/carboxypeptidase